MDVDDPLTTIAQLRAGMESRGRIGIAIGIVMATFDLDAGGAWSYLVRESRHGNVKMVDLAETVIAEQEDGAWPAKASPRGRPELGQRATQPRDGTAEPDRRHRVGAEGEQPTAVRGLLENPGRA